MLTKLDILKNNNVTVLCSGHSSENHTDDNDIVIVPNRSIIMPHLSDYKKIIWVNGTGWMRSNVLSWWKELAGEISVEPNFMLVRYIPGHDIQYASFHEQFQALLPNTTICKIPLSQKFNTTLSTGMRCLEFSIDSDVSSVLVAGMEMGVNTKYCNTLLKNKVVLKKGDDSFKRHLSEDISYINSLSEESIRKIIPVKKSGLYDYIRTSI